MRSAWFASVVCWGLVGCGAPPRASTPVASVSAAPSQVTAQLAAKDPPLPIDARILHGKLDNGLSYFVRQHPVPEHRAQFWLVVDAGSVLEDADQRGLAHFVEHMAFNGTRRFPKRALFDLMEKSGVRSGADLNASTSFDETVYQLQVPTDNADLVERTIGVLRDFADGISFDPQELEAERGVVLEEWRLGRGAAMRVLQKQAPIIFHGSRYAERLPIGEPERIQHAPRDALLRFYKDWYRPDAMAVIAVGDFAPTDIEARIRAEFASLVAPATQRERPALTLPPHADTLVSVESDPELSTTSVGLVSTLPHRPEGSARDYRRQVAEQLFNGMLNGRLDELARSADAPFLSASSGTGPLVRSADAFRQTALVKEDAMLGGVKSLLEEVARVERHGFTASELERAKNQVLRQFQHTVAEYQKRDGRVFAAELMRHFLHGEAVPGPEAELSLVQGFLPSFTLAELNQVGKTLRAGSRAIVVSGPSQMTKPSAQALLALSAQVEAEQLAAHEDATENVQLLEKPPEPGPVVATRVIPELGVTEWTLRNGVRVVVKPTSFRNDDVRMTAFSPGGTSLAADKDYESSRFAAPIVGQSGVGAFDMVRLRKLLAGKIIAVSPQIGELEEGMVGNAAPSDFELMLQLVYLGFSAPRRDQTAFEGFRTRESERVRNRRLSPEWTFDEEMEALSTRNHPRRRPITPELLATIDLDRALAFYKQRFADASDFTFLFVGAIELERLKPLVERYLGSLPSTHRKESWRDVRVTWPSGVVKKTIVLGTEPKARVQLTFHGQQKWSRDEEASLQLLSEVVSFRIRETLREDLGGIYGAYVRGALVRRPRQEYTFRISFACAPGNVDKLVDAVFAEVRAIQKNGIGDAYLEKIRETWRRAHELDLKDNAYWLRQLERAYRFGDDPKTSVDIARQLARATSEHARAAANRYLSEKQYILGISMPQGSSSPAP